MVDDGPASLRAIAKLDYEAMTAEAAARVKHQIALVDRGVQGLTFVNGGALVALFTLISSAHVHVTGLLLWAAFGLFSLGLVMALTANLAACLSQGVYYSVSQYEAWDAQRVMHGLAPTRALAIASAHARGRQFEFGGVTAAALALFAFLLGCGLALLGVLPV